MRVRLVVPTSRMSRAGAGHDIGDAEAIADFDELAARDHDFASRGELVQGQKDGGGIVVHGNAGGPGETLDQRGGVDIALAAAAACQVVFQVRIAGQAGERG